MLKLLREKKGNLLFAVLLFIISAVFIINFGPQSRGCGSCGQPTYAAEVYGETITPGEFRSAMILHGVTNLPAKTQSALKLPQKVLDGLIERNLLAREALREGFRVDEERVDREILAGRIYMSAPSESGPFSVFRSGPQRIDFSDERGVFQYENFRMFVQGRLRRSLGEFKDLQKTEILADQMRHVVTDAVRIGREEIREQYVREAEEVQLAYIRFSPLYYRDALEISPEDIATFRSEKADEVDREFERTRHRYANVEKQVRSRHVLIKVSPDAEDEVKETARRQIEAIRTRLLAGDDFADMARKYSQDPGSARRGGDLGFHGRGRMVEAFEEAEFALEPGRISDVVETRFGLHVIQVMGFREGDVPEDEAKNEIAERLLRDARGADVARENAARALESLKAGETLETMAASFSTPDAAAAEEPAPDAAATGLPEEQDDELAPKARETQKFNRNGNPIPGPSDPGALVRAAFDLTMDDPVPESDVRLGDDHIVFRLIDRTEATDEGFQEAFDRIRDLLVEQKRQEVLAEFVARLRREADADGAIKVNEAAYGAAGVGEEGEGEGEGEGERESDGEREREGADEDQGAGAIPEPAEPEEE